MSDTPEETARKRKLLAELTKLSEDAGLYADEATPDEIVASVKQVRKEMAQEKVYYSLDLDKRGVWLDMAIDDFGSARYWMTIEGQEIDLTEKEYRVLMEQRVEAYRAIKQEEQQRSIKLLEEHKQTTKTVSGFLGVCNCGQAIDDYNEHLQELIKGEQKPIHTHEIEVFGSPCDCGTRHEYCGECDWVEPCEPEGEQK